MVDKAGSLNTAIASPRSEIVFRTLAQCGLLGGLPSDVLDTAASFGHFGMKT